MKKVYTILLLIGLIIKLNAQSSIFGFNTAGDLTTYFTKGGSTTCVSQSTNTGLNGSGALNLPSGSCSEIFTTKEGYTMAGVGSKFNFSCYLKSEYNGGYGGVGFTSNSAAQYWSYAAPNDGIGLSAHGGGFDFTSGTTVSSRSWCITEFLNTGSASKWYQINLSIELKTNDTFEMIVIAFASDALGVVDSTKKCTHSWKVKNTALASSNILYSYFGFGGQRVTNFDNYKIELSGGSSVIQFGNPILTGTAAYTSGAVALNGNVTSSNGFAVTSRGFVYNTKGNPTKSDSNVLLGSGTGTFSSSLTTLNPGTYYFRAFATNSSGTSYGAEYEVEVPGPTVTWNGSNSTQWSLGSNWSTGTVPLDGSNIVFHASATNDLVLDTKRHINKINFNGSGKKLVLGDNDIVVDSFENNNLNSYVKTNGTGKLRIRIKNNISNIFPVGNSAYNPVTITNKTGATDTFSVQLLDTVYYNGSSSGSIVNTRVNKTWNIFKNNANTGSGVNFLFAWNANDIKGTLTNPIMNHHNGTRWEIPTMGTTTISGNSLTYNGYTGTFSPFAIGGSSTIALPIELSRFEVDCNSEYNQVQWTTASEKNNDQFELYKSTDAKSWKKIHSTKGQGTKASETLYSFMDLEKTTGYYRLKDIDFNGIETWSQIISSECNQSNELTSIYPNPAKEYIDISIPFEENSSYNIIDLNGRVLTSGALLSRKTRVNIEAFVQGVYIIEIIKPSEKRQIKIIKQ